MDSPDLRKIKETGIIAMFSVDELMDRLVLKGGNALDIIYGIAQRSSLDLDFSIEDDFAQNKLKEIQSKIEVQIKTAYNEIGYEAFDIQLKKRPSKLNKDLEKFWGGYKLEFKLIEIKKRDSLGNIIDKIRRNAKVVGPNQRRKFTIDISRFEFCEDKVKKEIDGYTIYVYAPELMLCEKLRSICQQTDEYRKIIRTHNKSGRARDFFDIYVLQEYFQINLKEGGFADLLQAVFAAKRVPIEFLGLINNYREFHREDFPSLRDTIVSGIVLKSFDFYFDNVINICNELKTLWNK